MWRGWRPALRIAWREARRAKGRSALVAALIGLPVLALTFAAVTYDSFRLTTAQGLDRTIGAADAHVRWEYDAPASQPPDGLGYGLMAGEDTVGDAREPATAAEIRTVLPPGARVVPELHGDLRMRTADGVGAMASDHVDLADPIHTGRVGLRAGRAPAAGDEVALTEEASRRLDASIGDTVQTADGSARWRVVGLVEYPAGLQREVLVFHPGDLSAGPALSWLVDTVDPFTWEEVRRLNRLGITVQARAVTLDPPPPELVDAMWYSQDSTDVDEQAMAIGGLVGGLAVLEVILLAGPAFAVGARRRQRELALVAVTGGSPAHQRRIVLADGLVLGLIGAVAGIGLGAAAAIAGQPLLEQYVYGYRAGGVRLWPQVLAGVALLAVVTGLLAALVPAAVAARQNVVMALAGRRGVVRSKKRWLALGLVLIGIGAAVAAAGSWQADATIILAGLIASQLGLVLCTPSLVGLVARAGRFLPLAPRIALRDTARNRAAAAPAISAVMAAVAASVALGMFTNGDQARYEGRYAPGMPLGNVLVRYQLFDQDGPVPLAPEQREQIRTAIAQTQPVDQIVEVPGVACPADAGPESMCFASVPTPPQHQCPYWAVLERRPLTSAEQRDALADPRCGEPAWVGTGFLETVVDDGSQLQVLTGASAADAAAAAEVLRSGGVVVGDPMLIVDGRASVEFWDGTETGIRAGTTLTAPAYALTTGVLSPYTVFVSPALVAAAGWEVAPAGAVGMTDRIPSQAEHDALNAALREIHENLWSEVERGDYSYQDPIAMVLGIAAGLITLGAAGIATGLAAADRRTDVSTLGAVGASPRVRRLLSLSQSGVIAGLGAILGTVAGIGAALTIMLAMNRRLDGHWPAEPPYPLLIPWQVLGIVLVAVPLVAMLGAGLLTRSRLSIERRLA
jgi:putative ABC transport system permease protein